MTGDVGACSAVQRRRGEQGAVAVVVALVVSLVILPLAALAVDLAGAYTSQAAVQNAADLAALAGVSALATDLEPNTAAAVDRAVKAATSTLCASANRAPGWENYCGTDLTWAGNGALTDGEIVFYTGTPDAQHRLSDQLTPVIGNSIPITGVRVVTPPTRVQFAFAGLFSSSHADVQQAATAALGSALPARGILPLWAMAGDGLASICLSVTISSCGSTALTRAVDSRRAGTTDQGLAFAGNVSLGVEQGMTAWSGVPPATGAGCAGLTPPLDVRHSGVAQPFGVPVNCLDLLVGSSDLSTALTNGLLGPGGRLATPCNGQTYAYSAYPAIDGTNLFAASNNPFVDTSHGSANLLWNTMVHGWAPTTGWITAAAMRCGRLAVVPMLDPPLTLPAGSSLPIRSFIPVWIDGQNNNLDDKFGLIWAWQSPKLTGIRVYNLSGYLPATVATTGTIGPYLGPNLPRQVALIHDVADPAW